MAGEAITPDNTNVPATTDTPTDAPKVETPTGDTPSDSNPKTDKPEPEDAPKTDPEAKPAEGDEGAPKEDTDKVKPEDGAPEAYADFTFPEGAEPDKATVEKFTALAKELNIPQEKAQELMNLAINNLAEATKKQGEAWAEIRENWVKEIKEDKEFGGEKFEGTLEQAKRTLRNYGSDELEKFISDTGYGDNPHLIRMLAKIDKALGEDKIVQGKEAWAPKREPHEILYGDTKERGEK